METGTNTLQCTYLVFRCCVFRGLESGLTCNDLLTNYTGLASNEELNRYYK